MRKIPFFFSKPNLTEMNRVYNELCKVIISDIPTTTKESEDSSSSALVSRISISDTVMNEEKITIMDNSNQSIQDDHCINLYLL